MNNLWTEKYRPKNFDDILLSKKDKTKMILWLKKIKNNNFKENCLFLYGPPGIGKTTIATLLLKELNFDIIEYNASDLRNQKKIKEDLEKINGSVNILDFMCNKKKKIGIIIDELDGISSTDRGSLKELISIINNSKKNSSPFICISNTLNKKFNGLKKRSLFFKIDKPTLKQITKIAHNIVNNENIEICETNLKKIILHSQNDIRRLISILEYYNINPKKFTICENSSEKNSSEKINSEKNSSSSEKNSSNEKMNTFLENIDKKNIDYSITEYTDKLLNNYIFEIDNNVDKSMVSFYLYENFVKYIIQNRDETRKKKFQIIALIYENFTQSDLIENFIYKKKNFDLYDYYFIYKCSIASYLMNDMKKFSFNKINSIDYSRLINKTSMEYINNKYLSIIKYNFTNYSQSNSLIYIIDLFYIYLFKNTNKKFIKYYIKKNKIDYEMLSKVLKFSTFYNKENKTDKFTINYITQLIES